MKTTKSGQLVVRPPASRRGFGDLLPVNTRRAIPFLLPAILLLALIILFPIAYSVNLTFRSYNLLIPGDQFAWVGLENYDRLIHDSQFGAALSKTGLFTVLAVSIEVILGIAIAHIFDAIRFGRRVLTSLLLVPTILTPIVIGLMFNLLFNAQFGLFSFLFQKLGLGLEGGVLNQSSTAFATLVGVDVWEWTPFIALIVLAGLQAMPAEPKEAARIDGANEWQLFRHVTLPLLRPVLSVAVLFRAAEAIREFDKVFILTGGGPGSATEVADLYLYRVNFTTWDLSYGATLGMAMFAIALVISIVYFVVTTRQEER